MKKSIVIVLAFLLVLSACQYAPNPSEPDAGKTEASQPIQNQGNQ